jgi:hypothetical protein
MSGWSVRVVPPIAWGFFTLIVVATAGVPDSQSVLLVWLGLAMIVFTLREPRRRLTRLIRDWSPFVGVLVVYDRLRGIADGLLFPAHTLPQIRLEEALFGRPVPTVWLQEHLWHGAGDVRWWDYAVWLVYLSHFVATPVLAGVLWVFLHRHFSRFAAMVCALAAFGFATYVVFPAAPPWLAAQHGQLGPAHRLVPVVWAHVPIHNFDSLFTHGVKFANNVAAVPSLHAAYALLVTLYLWRICPVWTRPLLALYPPAMTFALVYAGEHYVVDCIAGWLYAALVFVAVDRWFGLADDGDRAPLGLLARPAPVD